MCGRWRLSLGTGRLVQRTIRVSQPKTGGPAAQAGGQEREWGRACCCRDDPFVLDALSSLLCLPACLPNLEGPKLLCLWLSQQEGLSSADSCSKSDRFLQAAMCVNHSTHQESTERSPGFLRVTQLI